MASMLARRTVLFALWLAALGGSGACAAQEETTETISFIRHGEKPALGLGQLDCQGLNRALALPSKIEKIIGSAPDAIFAPDPSEQYEDHGVLYDYMRPLATIEPTAIYFGLPMNANIGVSKTKSLLKVLDDSKYHAANLLVAWEHRFIVDMARTLMEQYGSDPTLVPDWQSSDFDSVYQIQITRSGKKKTATATFKQLSQGLNGQPATCPGSSTSS